MKEYANNYFNSNKTQSSNNIKYDRYYQFLSLSSLICLNYNILKVIFTIITTSSLK